MHDIGIDPRSQATKCAIAAMSEGRVAVDRRGSDPELEASGYAVKAVATRSQ